jgi:MFS family permease
MPDKLPYGQLAIFTLCNLANGLSISVSSIQSMYPYASNMVMDFGLTTDRSATGYYVGYLSGGTMIGRAIGASFWGWVADTHGRKPTLIVSLVSIVVGSLAFGFAPNFIVAALTLFVEGLLCSLGSTCKTCVSEVTPKSLQAKATSCYALGWYYGQVAGFSVGGLLAHPDQSGLVESGLLVDFPYLLPNLFCSGIALISLIGVIFWFKETLQVPKSQPKAKSVSRESLSFLRSSSIIGVFVMYSLQVFCNTGFAETYPLWSWSDKAHGGLEFNPAEIGTTMTYSYIVMVCVQSVLYSRMVEWLGLIGVIRISSLMLIPVMVGLPLINLFKDSEVVLKTLLVIGCLCYYLLGFNIYTSLFVLTNNSVQQSDRGKVNGFQQACGYIVKGVTPLFVGYTFSFTSKHGPFFPFDYHFIFILLGVGMLVEAVMARGLSIELETQKDEEEVEKSNELELASLTEAGPKGADTGATSYFQLATARDR